MKRSRSLLLAAASAAVFFCAQASAQPVVTPGPAELRTGGAMVSSHADMPACVAAAIAPGAYECHASTSIVVPVPPDTPPPGWVKVAAEVGYFTLNTPTPVRFGQAGTYVENLLQPGRKQCRLPTFVGKAMPKVAPRFCFVPEPPKTVSLALTWQAPTALADGQPALPGDVTAYRIRYGTAPGAYTATVEVPGDTLSHRIDGLPWADYFAVVHAVAPWGAVSLPSVEVSKVRP